MTTCVLLADCRSIHRAKQSTPIVRCDICVIRRIERQLIDGEVWQMLIDALDQLAIQQKITCCGQMQAITQEWVGLVWLLLLNVGQSVQIDEWK